MPKGTRVLATACGGVLLLGLIVVPAQAASTGKPQSFIEALAALPDAASALADARTELRTAQAQRGQVRAVAQAAHRELDFATEGVVAAHAAMARAELAAAQAQGAIDDTARAMYSAGGSMPALFDVMLTSDSELGLARSLVTRQYLDAAGQRLLAEHERAGRASEWVAVAASAVVAQRQAAAEAAAVADSTLTTADAEVSAAQAVTDEARARYRLLMRMTKQDRSAEYPRITSCGDWLTKLLSRTGFEGEDLREAWAIVMRESGGRADAVSRTDDLGLFQINTATWRGQPWFDRKMLLTKRYNATIGLTLSKGGSSWYSWGLDGHGRPNAGAYVKAGWTPERIQAHIVMPYVQWYARYPCRPAYEKGAPDLLPPPPPPNSEDNGDPLAPFVGDGQLAGRPEAS